MRVSSRSAQLQIRVTPSEKAAILRAAHRAGLGMSAYVLGKTLPVQASQWQELLRELLRSDGTRIALAELSAWLAGLGASELPAAVASAPPSGLSDFHANYVAALVVYVCAARSVDAPQWTRDIAPLEHPVFASELLSLRLHLLTRSPPPFRRRNLFDDTVVGGQV